MQNSRVDPYEAQIHSLLQAETEAAENEALKALEARLAMVRRSSAVAVAADAKIANVRAAAHQSQVLQEDAAAEAAWARAMAAVAAEEEEAASASEEPNAFASFFGGIGDAFKAPVAGLADAFMCGGGRNAQKADSDVIPESFLGERNARG